MNGFAQGSIVELLQEEGITPEDYIEQIDESGDGELSRDEVEKGLVSPYRCIRFHWLLRWLLHCSTDRPDSAVPLTECVRRFFVLGSPQRRSKWW